MWKMASTRAAMYVVTSAKSFQAVFSFTISRNNKVQLSHNAYFTFVFVEFFVDR